MFTPAELAAMQHFGVTPPEVTHKMLDYTHLRYAFMFIGTIYTWLCLLAILHFGVGTRLARRLLRWLPNKFIALVPYVISLTILIALMRFPYSAFVGFHIEHVFGMSQQTFGDWLLDWIKAVAINAVGGVLVWWAAMFAVTKFPRRWGTVLWSILTPIIGLLIFVYPLVVDPIFNKYTPMPSSPMRAEIQRLAQNVGLAHAPVFVVDKSKQTNKINAEVTGLGSSARVVLWDTTLEKMPPDQILAVVGHELGHYALNHVLIGFALITVGLLIALLFLQRAYPALVRNLPGRWGIQSPTDLAVIPAVMLIASVLGFFFQPIDNSISRFIEHQADEYGLRITGDRGAMARAFVSLSEQNLSEPDPPPFIQFWFFSHPSLRERIDYALGITSKDD